MQHCCGNSFSFLKWSRRAQGIQGGLSKGRHWIMVYEYGYEHGYEKRKDDRTESQHMGHTNMVASKCTGVYKDMGCTDTP